MRSHFLAARCACALGAGLLALWAGASACSSDDGATVGAVPDGGEPSPRPGTVDAGDAAPIPAPIDGGDGGPPGSTEPATFLAPPELTASELGVLINTDDAQSVAIGDYYIDKRKIPAANVVRLALGAPTGKSITGATFGPWKTQVDAALPATVQALAITFTRPSVIEDCQSITSAFAWGFDKAKYCVACGTGPLNTLHSVPTSRPFTDLGFRPAMMIAAPSIEEGKKLVDRGVAADGTFPPGDGYFVRTNDSARSNPRYVQFQNTAQAYGTALDLTYIDQLDGGVADVTNTEDIFLYMTGRPVIPGITTNTYRPGAFADHLTSYAGIFEDTCSNNPQMNVLCWIEAGVTGSYGTVTEPCAWGQKFPEPRRFTDTYFQGKTLLEAIWRSVQWPGQGAVVGEPLARPFGRTITPAKTGLHIETTELLPKVDYVLEGAATATGPWTVLKDVRIEAPARYAVDVPLGPYFVRLRQK